MPIPEGARNGFDIPFAEIATYRRTFGSNFVLSIT